MRLSRPVIACYLAAGVFAAALTVSFAAHAGQEPSAHSASGTVAQNTRQQAVQYTQALMVLQKQWANATDNEKSRALEQLAAKAQARQEFLASLAQTHPADVLSVTIPEEQRQGMPAEITQYLEQKVEMAGTLEVFYEDYDYGAHQLRRFVKTPFGERFQLAASRPDLALQNGADITVEGVLLAYANEDSDGTLITGEEGIATAACCTQESAGSTTPPAGAYTFGEQKTLVMLINFQDKPEQPWTKEQVREVIFGTVNDFYLENSNDRTWFTGDVTGWLTLPMSSTVCDYYGLDTAAAEAASAAGINTSAYQRIVYAFPRNACGWSGLGSVGGTYSRAWLNGYVTPYVAGHELGHNLGLGHSGGLECGNDIIEGTGSCTRVGYGNRLDIMGSPHTGHFNAFQKERLGWLDQQVQTITSSGTYSITPYAGNDYGIKALKVLQGTDASNGQESWYYVEFRKPTGFDRFITESTNSNPVDAANVMNGVVINRGTPSNYDSGRLLDMTPGSSANIDYDFNDPALEVGQQFLDANAGVDIVTNWVDATQASISVNLGTQECVSAVPTMTLPESGGWVPAGATVEYRVSLLNNDSQSCAETTYDLSHTVPADWSATWSQTTLTLTPGKSASVNLSVTSAENASDGFYDIPLTVNGGGQQVADSLTYVVTTPQTNRAPVAQNDNAAAAAGETAIVRVLDNDSDPDGDKLTVSSVSDVNGNAVINGDGTISFTPASGFAGTEAFSYTISDGKGASASATVSVSVSAPSNRAPVAVDDSVLLSGKSAITIAVLSNDSDPDGDVLQVVEVTDPSKGAVTLNADGTITYALAKNFKSTDVFSYTLSDGALTASATVFITLDQGSTDTGGNGHTGGPGNSKGNKG
ncbi:MAG: tandem-95 repeat protein [Oceanospirillales bacterium]|nr:tandem-95 repeat protein [Oceanospirillales bacterium]